MLQLKDKDYLTGLGNTRLYYSEELHLKCKNTKKLESKTTKGGKRPVLQKL